MSEWEGMEVEAKRIEGFKPFPPVPEGALTVRGLCYFNGTVLVATDQGLYRVEGETLVKVEPKEGT